MTCRPSLPTRAVPLVPAPGRLVDRETQPGLVRRSAGLEDVVARPDENGEALPGWLPPPRRGAVVSTTDATSRDRHRQQAEDGTLHRMAFRGGSRLDVPQTRSSRVATSTAVATNDGQGGEPQKMCGSSRGYLEGLGPGHPRLGRCPVRRREQHRPGEQHRRARPDRRPQAADSGQREVARYFEPTFVIVIDTAARSRFPDLRGLEEARLQVVQEPDDGDPQLAERAARRVDGGERRGGAQALGLLLRRWGCGAAGAGCRLRLRCDRRLRSLRHHRAGSRP